MATYGSVWSPMPSDLKFFGFFHVQYGSVISNSIWLLDRELAVRRYSAAIEG